MITGDKAVKVRKKKRPKKPKSKLIILYVVFWVGIIGLSLVFIADQVRTYNQLRENYERVSNNLYREVTTHEELYMELQLFDSLAYAERRAREWLGMVRPNEIVFRNIGAIE